MVTSDTDTTEKFTTTCHLDKDDMSCQTAHLFPLFSEPTSRDHPLFTRDWASELDCKRSLAVVNRLTLGWGWPLT